MDIWENFVQAKRPLWWKSCFLLFFKMTLSNTTPFLSTMLAWHILGTISNGEPFYRVKCHYITDLFGSDTLSRRAALQTSPCVQIWQHQYPSLQRATVPDLSSFLTVTRYTIRETGPIRPVSGTGKGRARGRNAEVLPRPQGSAPSASSPALFQPDSLGRLLGSVVI